MKINANKINLIKTTVTVTTRKKVGTVSFLNVIWATIKNQVGFVHVLRLLFRTMHIFLYRPTMNNSHFFYLDNDNVRSVESTELFMIDRVSNLVNLANLVVEYIFEI